MRPTEAGIRDAGREDPCLTSGWWAGMIGNPRSGGFAQGASSFLRLGRFPHTCFWDKQPQASLDPPLVPNPKKPYPDGREPVAPLVEMGAAGAQDPDGNLRSRCWGPAGRASPAPQAPAGSGPPRAANFRDSHGRGSQQGSGLRGGLLGAAVILGAGADDPEHAHCGTERRLHGGLGGAGPRRAPRPPPLRAPTRPVRPRGARESQRPSRG